jgi:hypothetical protein
MYATFKKEVMLAPSITRKVTDQSVKGANAHLYWQLLFFDVPVCNYTKHFILLTLTLWTDRQHKLLLLKKTSGSINTGLAQMIFTISEPDCEPVTKDTTSEH